jgi:hypothetical protein
VKATFTFTPTRSDEPRVTSERVKLIKKQ